MKWHTQNDKQKSYQTTAQRDKSKNRIHLDHVVFMMSLAFQRLAINELTIKYSSRGK